MPYQPCAVCNGALQAVTQPETDTLPPGLHRVVGNALPVNVPQDQSWVRDRQIVRCAQCTTYFDYVVIKNGDTTMAEKAEAVGTDDAKKADRPELLEKVRRLSETIQDVDAAKKAASKDYNDQLKDLKDELHDTLELLKDTPEGKDSAG